MYRASRAIQDQLGTMSTAIQEDLAGIAVIKHYALEESRQRAFRGVNDEYLARSLALVRARGALMPLFAMLGGVGTLIVLWAGGREVIAGRMSVGSLVAFNGYLVLLSWPTSRSAGSSASGSAASPAGCACASCSTTPPAIADAPDDARPAERRRRTPSIEVRDLTIAADGRRLLDGVSFSLPAGATLAIVGPTGVGQDDAGRRRAAHAGGRAGRRRASAAATSRSIPLARAARADRLRAAGRVPVLGDGRRQHRLRHPRRASTRRRATSACGAPPRRPASRPTSPCCPTATTRSSASAASRCRAASASGWRWRARWPPTRRS